jgi:hypothetical protein
MNFMSKERDSMSEWGDDPENDRYTGRSVSYLPTDWSADLVNKDYVKPKHLNAISKALWSLYGLRHPMHYIASSELTGSVVAPVFFRAVKIAIPLAFVSYQKIKIHVTMEDNSGETATYGRQDIEWNDASRSIDSGNGTFAFIFRQADSAGGRVIELYLPYRSEETWSWWTECSANVTVTDALPGDALVSDYQGAISSATGWNGSSFAAGTTGKFYWDESGNLVIKGAVTAADGISGGNYSAGNGYKVSSLGFILSGLYNGVRKFCSLSCLSGGVWRLLIDVIQASSVETTTLSGQTANFSSTVSVKNLVNSGTTENTGSVNNAGNVLNGGDSTTVGISRLKGNGLNAGMLASFSQAQSAARVAITEVSVPAGSKVLFFERHHSETSVNHALGLYTNLADGASYVDSGIYTEVGDVSATFAYTNSTESAVTLYFMVGIIEEGNTISYTNIHWNYLFL